MGIQAFQSFIEQNCPNACVPVDLLKIARSVSVRRGGGGVGSNGGNKNNNSPCGSNVTGSSGPLQPLGNRLCLVVDGETCLDRLYGGYFSDWVCGGQWNRMVQFLAVLIQTVQANNIELAVFFNGCLEQQRMPEWIKHQLAVRKKINQVLKHVEMKATPPPKVWWVPPSCLSTCLRMALRHLNISVVCTMDDHHQEVIAYCRENNFHGLMAEDAEYAIFDPPRYFSSEQLKLTYKGSLETKEFILDEVAKGLDLHPNRFCVFAALLGNYLLNEEELADFYKNLISNYKIKVPADGQIKAQITAVCNFVRTLPSVDDLDAIGEQVFSSSSPKVQERINKFKHCVHYYLNGTKSGFLKYWPSAKKQEQSYFSNHVGGYPYQSGNQCNQISSDSTLTTDITKFASETKESELSSLNAYQEATGNRGTSLSAPEIVIDPPVLTQGNRESVHSDKSDDATNEQPVPAAGSYSSSTTNGTSSGTSIRSQTSNDQHSMLMLPQIPPEVMTTASERHQKGLMVPSIYQVLTQGEIKIPVCLEEEVPNHELPSPVLLFRPIRQMVYAILFNLHHIQFQIKQRQDQNKDAPAEKVPDIVIKEWVCTKQNQFKTPESVKAEPLGWPVPTVQRLWFGTTLDDKKRRIRAFLTCMNSDTPLMLNTSYVPQHLLIMCCVLRYILSQSDMKILRRQELHAFLAQAVSPRLMDAQAMQSMQLPAVSSRGVLLAALFMQGVEAALFANDACGAPIPWLMCCPWLFFDGKLFHLKLLKANNDKPLLEICDGQVDQVAKVEHMRQAILKGLKVEFARRPLPVVYPQQRPHGYPPPPPPHHPGILPAGAIPHPLGRVRGPAAARRGMLARGGQLEIAGVVVGSWGPNYGTAGSRGRSLHVAPQVTSVGGMRRFNRSMYSSSFPGVGANRGHPTTYGIRRPIAMRFRRQSTLQTLNTKKKKKTLRGGKDSDGDNSGADAGSKINRECTIEIAENKAVPISHLIKTRQNGVPHQAEGQFDDAKEAHSSGGGGDKSSPTMILKQNPSSSLTDSSAQEKLPNIQARNGPERIEKQASVGENGGGGESDERIGVSVPLVANSQ